jgi:hypothetical protein
VPCQRKRGLAGPWRGLCCCSRRAEWQFGLRRDWEGMAEMGGVVGAWTHAAGLLAVRPVCHGYLCCSAGSPPACGARQPHAGAGPGPGLAVLLDVNLTSLAAGVLALLLRPQCQLAWAVEPIHAF